MLGGPPTPREDRDPKQESRPAKARITGSAEASLRTLNAFATSLLAQEDLDDLIWSMAKNIGLLLGFEDSVIYLREGDELVQAAALGVKNPEGRRIKSPIRIPVGQGIVGAVGKTGRTERVGDTASDARYIFDEFAGRSELAVALMYQDKVLGVLDSEASTPDWYTDADQEMFERIAVLAAPRIALAIGQRERRKAEEALRRSEASLAGAQAVAHVGSWEWDILANEEWWSDETYRIFGVRPEDFTPNYENYLSRIHPDDRETVVAAVEAALQENKPVDVDYRIVRPDGTERIVNSRGRVFRDDRGVPARMVGTCQDITEQKRAEEALRRYESMVSASSDLMVFVDPTYTYQAVNPAYCHAHQKTREEILGHTVAEVLGQKLFETQVKPQLDRCLSGERVNFEFWWDSPGRGRRHVDARYDPFYDADGSVSGVLVDIRDTTDSREAEEALRQVQKMEAVGQLTGGMAHDFNNLLTVILTDLELIAGELPAKEAPLAELRDARDAALRGAELIRRLLAFSRQKPLRFQSVDLTQLLEEHVATVRRLLPETIEIQLSCDESCPLLMADPSAVQQILVNLATNARDAMPNGGMFRIEAEAVSGEKYRDIHGREIQGAYVCVSVSDTGVGMDEHTKQKIYEPFFTTKSPERGTGLGMAMVYGLVEQHRGSINIDSQPGQGTLVKIHFPVAREDTPATVPEREVTDVPGGTETILLVEDEAPLRRAAKRVLERYGYVVLAAPDGQEALQIFRAQRAQIALVVTDVAMPGMSGPELCRAIEQEAPMTKVILMSGYSSRDEWTRGGLDPARPLLAKPWTISEFLVRVREVLDEEASG